MIRQIDNFALAVTLTTCGVPFYRDETGQLQEFVHFYSVNIIRGFRHADGTPIYQGWTLEKAAAHAYRSNLKGKVVYNFVECPLLSEVMEGFGSMCEDLAAEPEKITLDLDPKIAARFAALLLKNRQTFSDHGPKGWKAKQPWLHLPGASSSTTEGKRTTQIGRFSLTPLSV